MLKAWGKRLRMGALAALAVLAPLTLKASEAEKPVKRHYVEAPAARLGMTDAEVETDNRGCVSCHIASDAKTMHNSAAVKLSCVSCHGGDTTAVWTGGDDPATRASKAYADVRDKGHVLPRFPK